MRRKCFGSKGNLSVIARFPKYHRQPTDRLMKHCDPRDQELLKLVFEFLRPLTPLSERWIFIAAKELLSGGLTHR